MAKKTNFGLSKIPKGFKLMQLELNLSNNQVVDFENYVLRYVLCSNYIFYTKLINRPKGFTRLRFYCQPKDEVTLAYRIGCAAGSALFHQSKKFWQNQIHDVAQPFPERYHINIEHPEFIEDFEETFENSENITSLEEKLRKPLINFDLSVRALRCLESSNIVTIGDLVSYQKNDLLTFRNFGKKSLNELEDFLKSQDVTFGLVVSRCNLPNTKKVVKK